jgi:Zn-dependent protease with chaperone function
VSTAARVRRLQALQLALVLLVVGIGLAALVLGSRHMALGRPSPHSFSLFGLDMTYPGANAAALVLLAIAALGALVLARALRLALTQALAYRRFQRSLPVVSRVPGHAEVLVFRDHRPQAFCAGLLRPRAYLSTGALRVLGRDELEAVIAHEAEHRRARDPLRLFVAGVAARAVFVLPLCALISDQIGTATELGADQAALRASGGDRRPLAGALLQMTESGHPAVGIDPERVDVLAGRPPAWRLPGTLVLTSLVTIAALAYGLWLSLRAAQFQASLALPWVSSKPCVLALALAPLAAGLLARAGRASGAGRAGAGTRRGGPPSGLPAATSRRRTAR